MGAVRASNGGHEVCTIARRVIAEAALMTRVVAGESERELEGSKPAGFLIRSLVAEGLLFIASPAAALLIVCDERWRV